MKLTDIEMAKDSWTEFLGRSTTMATPEVITEYAAQLTDQLRANEVSSENKKLIKPEQVFDFRFAKRADEELAAERWEPKKYRYIERKN